MELLTAREGDESTKYSQSPSADDRLHARFRNKSCKCVKNALKNTPETVCFLVELLTRLELVTSSLPRMCSTS